MICGKAVRERNLRLMQSIFVFQPHINSKSLVDAISFGINYHLEALGQAMAKALHVEVRVDVLANASQARLELFHGLRPGLPLCPHSCLSPTVRGRLGDRTPTTKAPLVQAVTCLWTGCRGHRTQSWFEQGLQACMLDCNLRADRPLTPVGMNVDTIRTFNLLCKRLVNVAI